MGEVYRARDTRLARAVAIKILPGRLASEPGARERFEREARTISQLSHPHICALYDLGHHEGLEYLVLEFLEGETLACRLERGSLPLEQTLRFGAQIASALGTAHQKGILHRDLKPANVMLTGAGVKLLDFGLAKALPGPSDPEAAGELAALPTRTELTQEGRILGTVPYMAPEQIEGGRLDARTDIFALGAVLYEMATGKRAFEGKSSASLMASILEREPPPIASLRPQAPAAFDRLVRVCLAKRPDDRWQSAADVARELSWIAESKGEAPETSRAGAAARRGGKSRMAWVGLALLAAGALAGWLAARIGGGWAARAPASGAASVERLSIVLPERAPLASASATPFAYLRNSLAVAPDDSRIACVSVTDDGGTQIALRRADQFDPSPIPGTEGGFDPFFSPDGRWIGFFTFDSLRKVSLDGGAPLTLAAIVNPAGGTWCDDGTIYVAGDEGTSLWRISAAGAASGGKAMQVALEGGAPLPAYPHCLPGSKGLLMTMVERYEASDAAGEPVRFRQPLTSDHMSVGLLDLPEGRTPRPLVARGYAPQYAASGHVVFARSGTLMAVPFDLARRAVTGPEAAMVNGVSMCSIALPTAQYAISPAGSLLDVPGGDQARTRLVWVDRQGKIAPTAAGPDLFGSLKLSPDGKRAVVEVGGLQDDVYVYDLGDGRRTRITSDGRSGRRGMWHPDGQRVIFYSKSDHHWVIKRVESDAAPELLAGIGGFFTSWSAAGTLAGERSGRIWTGTLERQTAITDAGGEWGALVAPNGRLVAYTSSRTGIYQVFAQPIPPTGQEWQVSADFGEEPIWSADSAELFYRRHSQWWSVPFAAGRPGSPRLLFQGPFLNALGPSYDVAPDGRFLMALPPATGAIRVLQWTRNWTDELSLRLPQPR